MKRLILLTLSLCLSGSLFGQDAPAQVDNIKFKNLNDDWVEMEVKIKAFKNTSPDAKNERFVDNIKVLGYFAYERDRKARTFDFYKAEVEVISIEQGKTENVYFYMPGVVVKRDRLPKTPPYYFVALEINGQVLPIDNRAYSKGTLNDDTIRSMKTKADAESEQNDYILKPSYNAPLAKIGARPDVNKMAPMIIREPKQ
ncbi:MULTISPECIES: hypothetical protein [unclassified Lentimonas]|uniref:hypothetical protein n=1 Tax=unclassified Lentimonas TaxID=2630993 RepID=UPI0013211B4F|nr:MULTISPECIES: hypothetical protein [unclassified Lentimonas]CAA6678088.1 Unannotated [Lentimonas sp. CC4]CAA6686023.1 Unannotated [Lentimonas sp. CC6]CAA6691772.1 Unannotated [Lentimonas sp. CC19]CAA6696320.1 Unannotated [Lentimonas sp. CC10]CAA7071272.1 Unannotated [Lentimonas sp. CC11]